MGSNPLLVFVGLLFKKICQNGRPGGREAPWSTSFGRRLLYRVNYWFFGVGFFKKSVKTAVLEGGNPPGALVLTKNMGCWTTFVVSC